MIFKCCTKFDVALFMRFNPSSHYLGCKGHIEDVLFNKVTQIPSRNLITQIVMAKGALLKSKNCLPSNRLHKVLLIIVLGY